VEERRSGRPWGRGISRRISFSFFFDFHDCSQFTSVSSVAGHLDGRLHYFDIVACTQFSTEEAPEEASAASQPSRPAIHFSFVQITLRLRPSRAFAVVVCAARDGRTTGDGASSAGDAILARKATPDTIVSDSPLAPHLPNLCLNIRCSVQHCRGARSALPQRSERAAATSQRA
jgi:hypothetical protein